jgi:acetyltransferase-like isoleucine patch superfamily enzyme
MSAFPSRIDGAIDADDVTIGEGVVVEEGVVITGKHGTARKVVLGDFAFIGRGTRILAPEFRLGDYSKLHASSFAHGELPLQIGRNCWIGGNAVLDSMGGLDIDDNVGIGAQSQLWTHMQFGDIVEGSRFHSRKYMHVQRDAWFVGHCIVSPVRVGERSMALVGSVITRDMLANHVYGGTPARDLTDRLGPQFEDRTIAQKAAKLQELVDAFEIMHPEHAGLIQVARAIAERDEDRCWFDVSTRTYRKRLHLGEVAFLRAHVPLIKFAPEGEGSFINVAHPAPGGLGESGSLT